MKRSRFTETQVVSILKEADAGMKVAEICRKHGISDATYYNWNSGYRGMEASDLRRMKELEGELSQYKRMYSDPTCCGPITVPSSWARCLSIGAKRTPS